ncbi:MAG: ABC transporter permease [Rickettsiales bacterium]
MHGVTAIFRKEWTGYFSTPVAYVFLAVFLTTSAAFTFYLSDFYGREQADLQSFFGWHPWLFLFFAPAVSMRMWAEERRSGTFETLRALPTPMWQFVLGKFLAAWAFIGVALVLTMPIWLAVDYLGQPDNGVALSGYAGSFILAGAYLAIGAFLSCLTSAQVVAFVSSIFVSFLFTVAGYPMVLNFFKGWLPQQLVDVIGGMSFLMHYDRFVRGLVEAPALIFFAAFIGAWLYLASYVLEEA